MIFITNHSNDNTGDLYVASNLCTPVAFVSFCGIDFTVPNSFILFKFMESLFPPALSNFLRLKEVTVFMLACGALIREKGSFDDIVLWAKR